MMCVAIARDLNLKKLISHSNNNSSAKKNVILNEN